MTDNFVVLREPRAAVDYIVEMPCCNKRFNGLCNGIPYITLAQNNNTTISRGVYSDINSVPHLM